jgi:hypothetical protein
MGDHQNKHRRTVERLLEDESLTAGLVDSAAGALLDWGLAQARALRERAGEVPAEAWETLRGRMAHVRQRAAQATPEAQTERVRQLLDGMPAWEFEDQTEGGDATC